jgi:phosphoribosylformylglycinamidine synthase
MGQLVFAIKGIGEACRALDFPIVSGNVSLYNETNGQAILPTPTIGGVGLIPDWSKMARIGFAGEGEAILLVGAPPSWGRHLGQSVYMRDIHGSTDGAPPPVDLDHERRAGDLVRALIREGVATAVHDLSDGGLAVALAEMAMASGIGATVDQPENCSPVSVFFGEDQGRYLLTIARDRIDWFFEKRIGKADVSSALIGTTGGRELKLGAARAIPLAELKSAHEGWFPNFMGN